MASSSVVLFFCGASQESIDESIEEEESELACCAVEHGVVVWLYSTVSSVAVTWM